MIRRHGRHSDDEPENQLRVTDRRRIYLDPEEIEKPTEEDHQPSLKPSYVEELEARTKAAEQQIHDVQARFDQLRRQLQQEVDDTRKRLSRTADERIVGEKASLIASLLPVLDDLERAIQAANNEASRETILEGLRGITTSFQNALSGAGVEAISAIGEQFDPELHEAVDTVETEPEMAGKVIDEYGRGFRMGDRLLRPARVRVGRSLSGHAQNATE